MSDAKLIRGQLRQIAKEVLPEVIQEQLFVKLQEEMNARLNQISKDITATLAAIDSRSKDVQSYVMREVANSKAPSNE